MLKLKTLLSFLLIIYLQIAHAQTTVIKGLTVVVEFSDAPFHNNLDSIKDMMNKPGFNGWGNEGSVRDYFLTQSAGKLDLSTQTVIKVSVPHPVSYYYDDHLGHDLTDIVQQINLNYPAGFQNLTLNPDGSVKHFHILTKGQKGAWAFGQQPGTYTIKNNGQNVTIVNGNITHYGRNDNPSCNTVCHEIGHNLLEWADYYQTAWGHMGNYCVMASAGTNKGPMPINPGLRNEKGWIDNVIEVGNITQTYTAVSNSYTTIYKYTNPYNPKEYLLIHPQVYGGYYQQNLGGDQVADQGLAVYYVDEDGGMDLAGYEFDYMVKLVQADNLDEMHDETKGSEVRGDLNDLFDNTTNPLDRNTIFRWKDGGEFGIVINNISAPGPTMTFTVNARPNTFIAASDKNGTISPAGVISAANGSSQTFTFTPFPGYEINQVKVNGAVITVTGNTYTATAGGTKTIHVTYKRKAVLDPIPAPWQHADIGIPSTSGISGQSGNTFYLESFGTDIGSNNDNFRFVYQTMTGDGSIEAQLTFANKPHFTSMTGIMIRESLNPDAAYSFLSYAPRNHTRVQQRTTTGSHTWDNPNGLQDLHQYNLYKWFKIIRQGNQISSYISKDRVNWVLMGNQTITMAAQVYVGLAVTGGLPNYPVRAQFTNITVVKSACSDPAWNSTAAYSGGAKVSFNGRKYTAQWWNQAQRPDLNSGAGKPWIDNGPCGTENQAPTVGLTSPVSGNNFRAPATISLSANAGDADGSISKVEFYNGSTLIGTVAASPYTYAWTNVPVGAYAITAKAYDNLNLTSTSSVANVQVTNNTAPVITVTAPLTSNGIPPKYKVGSAQTVSATVTDDQSVAQVVFTLLKTGATVTKLTAPYEATFTNLPAPYADGSLSYTITATDNEGAVSTTTVIVYKNRVPSVVISAPANNATYPTGSNITISALVNDGDWTTGVVEYFNGTTKLGQTSASAAGSTPVNFVWNNVANGTYTITAKATDDMGESSVSTAITVKVETQTSTCTAPAYNAAIAYSSGSVVSYNGIKYVANWWTQGQRPDLNSGAVGTGMSWTSQGNCTSKTGAYNQNAISSVYPNPTSGRLAIVSETDGIAYVFNAYGFEVATLNLTEGTNEFTLAIPAGIYTVILNNSVTRLVIE